MLRQRDAVRFVLVDVDEALWPSAEALAFARCAEGFERRFSDPHLERVSNAVGESWTVYYALAIGLEVLVLAVILRWAWAWPRSVVAAHGPVVATVATS